MKLRVVILPDGNVRLFADEGSFGEAAAVLQAVAARLDLAELGEIEQHRHAEDETVHVHADGTMHVH